MAKERFYEIIKDYKSQTFEILGISSDDTKLIDVVMAFQEGGWKVFCETPDANSLNKEDVIRGYAGSLAEEVGLYSRLKREYKAATGNLPG